MLLATIIPTIIAVKYVSKSTIYSIFRLVNSYPPAEYWLEINLGWIKNLFLMNLNRKKTSNPHKHPSSAPKNTSPG